MLLYMVLLMITYLVFGGFYSWCVQCLIAKLSYQQYSFMQGYVDISTVSCNAKNTHFRVLKFEQVENVGFVPK